MVLLKSFGAGDHFLCPLVCSPNPVILYYLWLCQTFIPHTIAHLVKRVSFISWTFFLLLFPLSTSRIPALQMCYLRRHVCFLIHFVSSSTFFFVTSLTYYVLSLKRDEANKEKIHVGLPISTITSPLVSSCKWSSFSLLCPLPRKAGCALSPCTPFSLADSLADPPSAEAWGKFNLLYVPLVIPAGIWDTSSKFCLIAIESQIQYPL